MAGFIVVHTSQVELAAAAAVLSLACVVGAVLARTRAPAVSVGLVTALIVGGTTFLVTLRGSPHGVPLLVLELASIGLAVSGLLALVYLPAPATAGSLRRAATLIVASAPVLGLAALLSIQHACPLYVRGGSGYCHYEDDVMGGWSAAAAVIVGLDVLLIVLLVWITAMRSDQKDIDSGEHANLLVDHSG